MGHAIPKPSVLSHPEYRIYVYHQPENTLEGQSDWERRSITFDFHAALTEALALYQSRNFKKVEIRQHSFNHKTAQIRDFKIRSFTRPPEQSLYQTLWQKILRRILKI